MCRAYVAGSRFGAPACAASRRSAESGLRPVSWLAADRGLRLVSRRSRLAARSAWPLGWSQSVCRAASVGVGQLVAARSTDLALCRNDRGAVIAALSRWGVHTPLRTRACSTLAIDTERVVVEWPAGKAAGLQNPSRGHGIHLELQSGRLSETPLRVEWTSERDCPVVRGRLRPAAGPHRRRPARLFSELCSQRTRLPQRTPLSQGTRTLPGTPLLPKPRGSRAPTGVAVARPLAPRSQSLALAAYGS